MKSSVELLKSKNGTWIAVDTNMCEWVLGFAEGDKVILTYAKFNGDGYDNEEVIVTVMAVQEFDGEKVLIAKYGTSFIAVPDYHIFYIEAV